MSLRNLVIIVVLIIIVFLWYLFRPERLFISKTVNEKFPEVSSPEQTKSEKSPRILFSGDFHNGAHETKGLATIYELAGGKRVLRFTDFETSNGPEVVVYLIAADDAIDSDTVKNTDHISLGPIKGNIGDQNYDIPSDVDLTKYHAVTIWCQRFGVNFGTAPLTPSQNQKG
jgi:Electron transfer DM13